MNSTPFQYPDDEPATFFPQEMERERAEAARLIIDFIAAGRGNRGRLVNLAAVSQVFFGTFGITGPAVGVSRQAVDKAKARFAKLRALQSK